ncbi:MAG: nuclear transport factor 2 family protein [Gammaproteobacteria bacterium]|nr:nuclear transport factor 2 family protein [Gammaproteobacteria bacterium]
MSELESLKARVDRLESRYAITDLVSNYASACDEHDMPRLVDLFTEDARFDSPSGAMVADNRAAIEKMFIELFKIRGPAFHWTHDVIVKFDDAQVNRATGRVYSHAETTPGDIVSLAAMKYDDEYQRQGTQWRFKKRVISFLYYVPVTEFASALNNPKRLTIRGTRMNADYPESLPSWQQFVARYGKQNS